MFITFNRYCEFSVGRNRINSFVTLFNFSQISFRAHEFFLGGVQCEKRVVENLKLGVGLGNFFDMTH